ncbi:MerR family transcriptional regulator [Cellulomonas sp. JZ18]|uniref:MerR family transcriptional regulator n=1 Tax=Cellulomonas sp. JZ18 TaxID=2654191 RepID=UPI001E475610|nr:MerR family transcriptional regulator [Cellulomonas sp. JZ18]
MTEPEDPPTAAPASPGTHPRTADGLGAAPDVDAGPLPGSAPLTVAAVARRLGVAPATLRTWDRRYGLGPSEHSAGAHRRYSGHDLERLLVMRRLTLEGVAPAEAARLALASAAEGPRSAQTSTDLTSRLPAGEVAPPVPAEQHPDATPSPQETAPRAPVEPRTGTTPSTAAAVVALVDAALAGRSDRCAGLLTVGAPEGSPAGGPASSSPRCAPSRSGPSSSAPGWTRRRR